jgi:diguanylate cyclase (GGDEF)-like protein
MHFTKLHSRIIFTFSILLFLVLMAILFSINGIFSNNTNRDIQKHLDTGHKLFNFINEENSLRLTQTASILASDFAFREAIATGDRNTIISALANHRARFQASAMFLVNADHQLIADTTGLTQANEKLPFPELIVAAENDGTAAAIVLLNGQLYQIVVVPVLAPTPIAWLASGFIIDDNYARQLQSMTGLEVSLLTRQNNANQWQLQTTTLPSNLAKNLASALSNLMNHRLHTGELNAAEFTLGDEDYLSRISILASSADLKIVAVLQRSLREALAPLYFLQKMLLVLSLLAFTVALIASAWIARSITNPIRQLSAQAQRIEAGDYSQITSKNNQEAIQDKVGQEEIKLDEIGQLAASFNNMSQSIAVRETKIIELANNDLLTGLPNRAVFLQRLETAIKNIDQTGAIITVMMMDIDRFKEVNEILGHQVGDLLLKEVARRLQTVVSRESDTVARLGGDEFAILMMTADDEGTQFIANKVLKIFDQSIMLEGQEIIANASIGIAYHPQHGEDMNTLLSHADLAMYAAKRNHASYLIYDASLESQSQQHLSLMAELRHALANSEFTLYYQPKIALATGAVSHVEALIRWDHPLRGQVTPDNFIPFAEHTGFIIKITRWVIEQVIRQQQEWIKTGVMINVSINISARDLIAPKLPAIFAKLMQGHDVPPQCLMLEITESSIMANLQGAMDTMNTLRSMGLQMSVDDFGTGYSSLAYLKRLPVSELKIDRSFVINMESGSDDAIIVRSTIDLAHNMGLTVVAEGVENQGTYDMLAAMGCDYLQGFYISRPLTADALPQWIKDYHGA